MGLIDTELLKKRINELKSTVKEKGNQSDWMYIHCHGQEEAFNKVLSVIESIEIENEDSDDNECPFCGMSLSGGVCGYCGYGRR